MFNMKIFFIFFFSGATLLAQTLSLQSAIEQALASNSDIIISKYEHENLEKSKESLEVEKFGKLDLRVDYNAYNTPRTLMPLSPPINPNVSTSDDLLGGTLSYSINLFDGHEKASELSIMDVNIKMQRKQKFILEKNLIYATKATFIKILSLQNQLTINQKFLEHSLALSEEVKLKHDTKKASKIDVLHAHLTYTQNLAKQKNLQSDLRTLKAYLAQLLNKEVCECTLEEVPLQWSDIPTNFDVKQLESLQLYSLQEQKKEQERNKAYALYYPKVDFFVSRSDVYGAGDHELISQYGLSFRWNIFDFGKKSLLVEKSSLEILKAKTESTKKHLEMIRRYKEIQEKCQKFDETIETSYEQLRLQESIENIEKIKYEESVSTLLDYIEAKNKKELSYFAWIDAKYNRLISGFELDNLLEK